MRVLSAYRPVFSTGPSSTYQQHVRGLHRLGRHGDPRLIMLEDIKTLLKSWIEEGDHILVAMDANEDVRSTRIQTMFHELGMSEIILTKHSSQNPLSTHQRNSHHIPIDGIWGTPLLQPTKAG